MRSSRRTVIVAASLAAIGITVIGLAYGSRHTSDKRILEKFACNRFTADNRATDIFCDPSIYRHPYLTTKQFKSILQCDQVLETVAKAPGKDDLFYAGDGEVRVSTICENSKTLEQTRVKYNRYLRILKAENPL